ncbi:MAG: hypothetical protein JF615_14130 [Asticcacaulis sp.]|nr:hypothetical protein [Asticcacaulis sp.]
MSLASDIETVVKRLDQQLTCTHVVVEAVKQLIDMYAREPADIRRAVDLHNYVTLQFARYHARQIGRSQLVDSLEAAREVSRLLADA